MRRNGSESGPAPTGAPLGAPPPPSPPGEESGSGRWASLNTGYGARTNAPCLRRGSGATEAPSACLPPPSGAPRARRASSAVPFRSRRSTRKSKNESPNWGKPHGPLASSPIRFGLDLALGPCRACRCVLSVRPRRGRGARNWPPAATRRPDKERQTKAILHLGFFICAKRGPRLPSDMKAQNPHTNPYPVLGRGGGPWGRGSSAPRLRGTCCACPPAPPSQRFPHEARSWSRISARGIQRSIRRHLSRLNSIRLLRSFWRTGCQSHFSVKRRLEER